MLYKKVTITMDERCKSINDVIINLDDGTNCKKIFAGDLFTEGVDKNKGNLTYGQALMIWNRVNKLMQKIHAKQ